MTQTNEIMDPIHAQRDLMIQKKISIQEILNGDLTQRDNQEITDYEMQLEAVNSWLDGFYFLYLKLAPIVVQLHGYAGRLQAGKASGLLVDPVVNKMIDEIMTIAYTRIDPTILKPDGTGFTDEYLEALKAGRDDVQPDVQPSAE